MRSIIVPFDVFTDIKITNDLLIVWGYISNNDFKMIAQEFVLTENDRKNGVLLKSSLGNYSVGQIFPVNKKYKNSYAKIGNWLLKQYECDSLCLISCNKTECKRSEIKLLKEYLKKHSKYEIYGIFVRILYLLFFKNSPDMKDSILLFDRRDKAGDNAEALFRYLNTENKNTKNIYFSLKRKSSDWKRLCKMGKVIPHGGYKYLRLFWGGAKIVSSYADKAVWMPFRAKAFDTYRDIVHEQKIYFLQHGVIKDDLSKLYNSTCERIGMFVTTTKQEYKSLLCDSYGFIEGQVRLTGLPRYDYLDNKPRKCITFMPTWRVGLRDSHGVASDFRKSDYYMIMYNLLAKPEILDIAEKYGYQVRLMQHPMMSATNCIFEEYLDPRVKILPYNEQYSNIFSESSLIITDYSSVAFDFAYLRKPVVYYQEDYNSFFSGNHNYVEGYFNYDRDGFGEVVKSKKELLNVLESYLGAGCRLKDCYRNRINQTFVFDDKKNCERVFNELINIVNRGEK